MCVVCCVGQPTNLWRLKHKHNSGSKAEGANLFPLLQPRHSLHTHSNARQKKKGGGVSKETKKGSKEKETKKCSTYAWVILMR